MNFSMVRTERIVKLQRKRDRILYALRTFPYTIKAHILEDVSVLEEVEKEIEIQESYRFMEHFSET